MNAPVYKPPFKARVRRVLQLIPWRIYYYGYIKFLKGLWHSQSTKV